jgi:hypothetical protein
MWTKKQAAPAAIVSWEQDSRIAAEESRRDEQRRALSQAEGTQRILTERSEALRTMSPDSARHMEEIIGWREDVARELARARERVELARGLVTRADAAVEQVRRAVEAEYREAYHAAMVRRCEEAAPLLLKLVEIGRELRELHGLSRGPSGSPLLPDAISGDPHGATARWLKTAREFGAEVPEIKPVPDSAAHILAAANVRVERERAIVREIEEARAEPGGGSKARALFRKHFPVAAAQIEKFERENRAWAAR